MVIELHHQTLHSHHIQPYKSCTNFNQWYVIFITKVFQYTITKPQGLVEPFANLPQQNICNSLYDASQVAWDSYGGSVQYIQARLLNVLRGLHGLWQSVHLSLSHTHTPCIDR
jgi:hypothetical protein